MRITGITCCVGEQYAFYLRETLPVWMGTLDSLVVVSDAKTLATMYEIEQYTGDARAFEIETDAFTRNAAHFNKGLALNEGIAAAKPTDWLLAFDCDILPPSDWREQAERFARRSCLNSALRYKPDGQHEDRRFYPRGYFQLWHTSDPHYRRAPIFDEHHKHAGGYDTAFAHQWPQEHWNDLRFRVTHLGKKAAQWFGPGTTPQQMSKAKSEAMKMRTVKRP